MQLTDRQLESSRHDLRNTRRYPPKEVFVEGRYLKSDGHDYGAQRDEKGRIPQMHWYRKILKDFDPQDGTVVLSKQGSRRLLRELSEPDREYMLEELYEEFGYWMLKPVDHVLF